MRTVPRSVTPLGLLTLAALSLACGATESDGLQGASFTVGRTEVDFGDVGVGQSGSSDVSVQNTGTQAIEVAVETDGSFSDDFRFSPAQLSLEPGTTGTVQIDFFPSSAGVITATLVFRAAAPGVPTASLSLRGTGLDDRQTIQVSAQLVDFGGVVLDSQTSRDLVLTNAGTEQLQVRVDGDPNVGFCDDPSGDFADFCVDAGGRLDLNQRIELDGGEAVTLAISYAPGFLSRSTGQVRFRACENCTPVLVELEGRGLETGLSCDESLDFARVFPGTCRTLQVACRNVANLPTTINRFGSRPGRSLPIEYRPAILSDPVTIAPGGEAGLPIDFCPDDISETTAIARIDAADPFNQEIVALVSLVGRGGGPRPEVSPGAIDFGQTALIAGNSRQVTLRNTGFDDLIIRRINVDTATTGAFTAVSPAGRIEPGRSISFDVEFLPTAEGLVRSSIRFDFAEVPPLTVALSGVGVNLPPCTYDVESELDFGTLSVTEVRAATTLIRNTGRNDCLLYRVARLPSTSPVFDVVGSSTVTTVLAAGEARAVQVRLLPGTTPGVATGGLEVQASSPSQAQRVIALRAEQLDAGPIVAPHILDFGVLGPTCLAQSRTVTIRNPLSALIQLTSVQLINTNNTNAFSLGPVSVPVALNPRQSIALEVSFSSPGVGVATGFVELAGTINGQPATFKVPVRASVEDPATRSETFRQGHPSVDVLGAFCMTFRGNGFLNAARTSWGTFAEALVRDGVDYRIGITSTDIQIESGQFLPLDGSTDRVITSSTPSPAVAWGQRFRSASGTEPAGTSSLEAVRRALSFSRLTMSNSGFRRPGGPLEILVVIPALEGSTDAVQSYVDGIAAGFFPGQQNDWRISGLAVPDSTSSCSGVFGFGFANAEIGEAVAATGGDFISWCETDGPAMIRRLGAAAAGLRTTWRLAQGATDGTLGVRVNGASVPAEDNGVPNWIYNATSQTLTFTQAGLPEAGDVIEVGYQPVCAP